MMKALGAGGVNVSSTWDVIKAFPVFNPHTDYSVVMIPATWYYSGIVWMGLERARGMRAGTTLLRAHLLRF